MDSETPAQPPPPDQQWTDPTPVDPGDLDAIPALKGKGLPPVTAVIVSRDPGEWLEEALEGMAEQDYSNLSIVVIDDGSATPIEERVINVLPEADIVRTRSLGFGGAANSISEIDSKAAFYLFCHDDVRLDKGSIQAMVGEAFRGNAGIVGAKLVDWDDPTHMLEMGHSVDKFGYKWPVCERGELDQSQYDSVNEVFMASTAILLVRRDLFTDIGGFSADIDSSGQGLDFCWRAQITGGRTLITPAARGRHRERSSLSDPVGGSELVSTRNQTRILLACYEPRQLFRILPQAFVLGFLDMLVSVFRGRFSHVGDVIGAAGWNLVHLPATFRARKVVAASRRVPDKEVRSRQIGGSARLTTLMRGVQANQGKFPQSLASAARIPDRLGGDAAWLGLGMAIASVVLFVVGSRSLISGGLPAIGEFMSFDAVAPLFREWWSGWRSVGLGADSAAPSLTAGGAIAGWLSLGNTGLARTVLFLVPVPLGLLAMWRLGSAVLGPNARIAATAAYLVNPVPYNAISEGRWQALVVYAAFPSLLRRIAMAGRWKPFVGADDVAAPTARQIGGFAGLLLVASIASPVVLVWCLVLLALIVPAMILTGDRGDPVAAMSVTLGAVLLALAAQLPWAWAMISSSRRWEYLLGASPTGTRRLGIVDALTFDTGPVGSVLSAGLIIGATYVVLAGRGARFRWGVVSAATVLVSLTWVVFVGRASAATATPPIELVLAPMAAAAAFGIGLGLDTFREEVLGQAFGWRQALAVATAALAGLAALPYLLAVPNGRWEAPEGDLASALAPLEERSENSRLLWIGDSDVLPMKGWDLHDGVRFALTEGVATSFSDLFPHAERAGESQLREVLDSVERRSTSRAGEMLASFGVRYVVVSERVAPLPYSEEEVPAPRGLLEGLAEQSDLSRVEVAPGVVVYENAIDGFTRAEIPPEQLAGTEWASPSELVQLPTPERNVVLTDSNEPTRHSGELGGSSDVVAAQNLSDRWALTAGDETFEPLRAYGWASRFADPQPGEAVLEFDQGFAGVGAHLVQLAALLSIPLMVSRRLRRGGAT